MSTEAVLTDTYELRDTLLDLETRISELLRIPRRPIRVRLVRESAGVAKTVLCAPPRVPTVYLSPDMLHRSVLAHELTHCFVPTRWLFLAEGLATWVATEVGGEGCADLYFASSRLEEVLVRPWSVRAPTVAELVDASTDAPDKLDPQRFPLIQTRLAFAVAGSFCGFWQGRRPQLATLAASDQARGPRDILAEATGMGLDDLEQEWSRWLHEESTA